MSANWEYSIKFEEMVSKLPFNRLVQDDRDYLKEVSFSYELTYQELRKVIEIMTDFTMWQDGDVKSLWPSKTDNTNFKQLKKKYFKIIESKWNDLKSNQKSYEGYTSTNTEKIKNLKFEASTKGLTDTVLGKCPVASEKTLCCNLQTLDVVNNCGFECSYCSIQSFYPHNTIIYEVDILKKLQTIELDPNKTYHIGTGQASDSMFWGNKIGIMDELMEFARQNPNVILELKTKSKNIAYFLNHDIPKNVVCTWSLNTQTIIQHEEHQTASLAQRIGSARKLADKGILVGFHLHPVVVYNDYKKDYLEMINLVVSSFTPNEVAMISIGTLTFTKPVMKEIRRKDIYSKILQMPLVETSGKLSYPDDTKIEIFKHIYDSFKEWHGNVFFYLCMEAKALWLPVFGFEYDNNTQLEAAMKNAYLSKIQGLPEPVEN
jgi:spore photoproduct lyase